MSSKFRLVWRCKRLFALPYTIFGCLNFAGGQWLWDLLVREDYRAYRSVVVFRLRFWTHFAGVPRCFAALFSSVHWESVLPYSSWWLLTCDHFSQWRAQKTRGSSAERFSWTKLTESQLSNFQVAITRRPFFRKDRSRTPLPMTCCQTWCCTRCPKDEAKLFVMLTREHLRQQIHTH